MHQVLHLQLPGLLLRLLAGHQDLLGLVSGAYNGITPSASDTITLPARPIASPAPVTSGTLSRVSDETNKISWVNHPTAGEPYSSNTQVDRYIYPGTISGYAGQAWNTVAYVSGTSTSYSDAGAIPNRKWYYRIYARNSAGNSAGEYTNVIYTAPGTPSSCTRYDNGANQRITWANNVNYDEYAIEVWHAANGVWDAAPLITLAAGSGVTEYIHSGPSAAVKHKYRVRAKTVAGGQGQLYSSYSGETTETPGSTTAPNAPTNLAPATPTVADRDAPIVFTWTHTPSTDGSAQTAFLLQHREVGNLTWTTVAKVTSAASNYTLAHSYGYSTELEWQVQTWGADPVASPFSAVAKFFTSEPVPRRYPMYLDVTSGRVEADSTPDSGGGGIQWGSWTSVTRNAANWSTGTVRYRRSLDGSLVHLDLNDLRLVSEAATAAQGNLSPDINICTLPTEAWPETWNVVQFGLMFSGSYVLLAGVATTGSVSVYGATANSYTLTTTAVASGSHVYGTPSTGGGSLGLAPLVVQEEGSPVMPGTTTLDFVGSGVTATAGAAGKATVTVTGAPASHSHAEADLPTTLATDTEVATAVSNHAAAADPHTGYQKESEKAAVNGYASLDATTKVPIAQVPTGTSSTTAALGNHGHALTDANVTGVLPIAQVPTGQTSTTVPLGNDARFTDARTPTTHVHTITDLPVAPSGTSNTTQVVRADDSRLSNARTPSAHVHAAADTTSGAFVVDRLGATPAATTYLKGAAAAGTATWVVPSTLKTDLALTKTDVGLSAVPNTDATARASHTGTQTLDTTTDTATRVAMTPTERTKLTGIATAATANSADATLLARANHTGTQLKSTISDFAHTHVATTDLTATGTKDSTTYLRGDNTWATPAGGGGTSVVVLVPVRQVYTASGTWTKPAGLVYAEVECQGGGGGGSGVSNSTASTGDAGSSGGGGGYVKKVWLDAALSATETVTVGTGGTAGPASDAGGGAGVASSFKTQIANGGGGGTATGNAGLARSTGGAGGGGSGGDFTVAGGDGPNGSVIANGGGTSPTIQAVNGGASFMGGACRPAVSAAGGVGQPGQAYGGGGGGGFSRAASGAFAGGAGAPGLIIITSYMPANPAGSPAPTGEIKMWPTATAPSGYLLCDGAAIPAGNTALIALVGANTPDMRGRMPIGAGTFAALGASDGLAEASRSPVHAHTNPHTHSVGGQDPPGAYYKEGTGAGNVPRGADYSGHAHGGVTGGASSATQLSASTAIAYYGVNYIIKT